MDSGQGNKDKLRLFLSRYFNYQYYDLAILKIRRDNPPQWPEIKATIHGRLLNSGEALDMVHNAANQVLDENSDAEAYKWLDLMVENVESTTEVRVY